MVVVVDYIARAVFIIFERSLPISHSDVCTYVSVVQAASRNSVKPWIYSYSVRYVQSYLNETRPDDSLKTGEIYTHIYINIGLRVVFEVYLWYSCIHVGALFVRALDLRPVGDLSATLETIKRCRQND